LQATPSLPPALRPLLQPGEAPAPSRRPLVRHHCSSSRSCSTAGACARGRLASDRRGARQGHHRVRVDA
jgi:hypothetical protein